MINKNNNLNLLLTKMAYGVYDTYSVDERWLDGGPPWGKTKKQVAEDTKRFADEAKAQDLNLTFSSHRYGEGSMSPDEAIAKILKAKTKKDLMGYDKDLPYFYTLATQEPGFFNFLSERKPLDYDNHPLYKESSIKVANNLMSLVGNKQAEAKREASKEKSLHDWFSRKGETGSKGGWVDCNAPDGSGGYKTCGRSSGEERGEYPACRPTPGACKEKGRGDSWGKKSEEDKKKDDACTRKVKARYDVWPSAYASGALTKCRQVGADNWGNKTKEAFFGLFNQDASSNQVTIPDDDGNTDVNKSLKNLGFNNIRLHSFTPYVNPYTAKGPDGKYYTVDLNEDTDNWEARPIEDLYGVTKVKDLPDPYNRKGPAFFRYVDKEASASLLTAKLLKLAESAAWQRSEGKNPEGGLNRKGVASYREENPGSKLQMAVTTDPSKLDPDSKAAKRRKSFCARMGGMPGPMQDEKGRPTRKALSLRKWNC